MTPELACRQRDSETCVVSEVVRFTGETGADVVTKESMKSATDMPPPVLVREEMVKADRT
jgi:hypothetical protein